MPAFRIPTPPMYRLRPRAPRLFLIVAPLVVAAAMSESVLRGARSLPGCDSAGVRERLAGTLEDIPAFAGRDARLLDLDHPRARGYAGRVPLRACQGLLVTSAGRGAIEYSIRRGDDGTLVVRPELFQGGWRPEIDPVDS